MQPAKNQTSNITADLDCVQNTLLPEILKEQFPNAELNTLTTVRTLVYPYSTIRIIQYLDKQKTASTLFIKRITVPNKELITVKNNLRNETVLLQQLNREMSGETVELIHSFPEQQIIVTKECPGKATDSLINAYSFWWKNSPHLRDNLPTHCGNWLKRYHLITGQESQDLTTWLDYLSGEMIWRIRALKEQQPKNAKLFENISDSFLQKLNQIDTQGYSCSYHGDFAPHNIFYDNNRIRVIDFYDAQTGHPIIDLVNFISSIATRSESPLYPKLRIKKFCQQFLAAYGQLTERQPELASLLFLLQSIKRLLVLESSAPSRLDNKLINYQAKRQHIYYLNNYINNKNDAKIVGPWPYLNLSALTC